MDAVKHMQFRDNVAAGRALMGTDERRLLKRPRKMEQPARKTVFVNDKRSVASAATFLLTIGMTLVAGCHRAQNTVTNSFPTTAPAVVGDAPADPAALPDEFTNSIGMWLAPVTPGEFVMGSPTDEVGRDPDEIQHNVRITKSFFLGVYQVTQKQYLAVMGSNPSYFKGDDLPQESRGDLPVDSVSWDDAVAFCKKLSEKEGKTYRLPTEAEREYACRAGTTGPYAGDGKLYDISWCLGSAGDTTHPVGLLLPNDWGFYDMQGNVWEWCADWYGEYPPGDATDPTGPTSGKGRVLRGGAFGYDAANARSAFRNWYAQDARVYHNGFRVVLESQ